LYNDKKQPPMPIIDRDTLYAALYTPLDKEKEKDSIRTKTLKTLLGVEEKGLNDLIARYKMEKDANEIVETDEKDKQDIQEYQGADNTLMDFNYIVNYWQAIHDLYVCYLEALKDKYNDIPINKILIYEAPPMPDKEGKINYILAESCKVCEKSENCNDNFQIPPSGPYFDTIKGLNPKSQTIQEILVEQGILFIDLCPLPLPMTSKIRKEIWGKKFDSTDDKPLSVVLLELALEFVSNYGIEISNKPIIAMGTPSATSQSIYLYFEKKKPNLSIKINDTDTKVVDFSKLLNINKKYEKNGQILPLYASNIIAGSNTPNADLLQRIF
jgi:hypothetical protein